MHVDIKIVPYTICAYISKNIPTHIYMHMHIEGDMVYDLTTINETTADVNWLKPCRFRCLHYSRLLQSYNSVYIAYTSIS